MLKCSLLCPKKYIFFSFALFAQFADFSSILFKHEIRSTNNL